jgi:hypothetical protein
MNTQLLIQDLLKAHLQVWGSRTGAKKPENLCQWKYRAYSELYGPLTGTPVVRGGDIVRSLKGDVAGWNSTFTYEDKQPTVTQCREAAEILYNFKRTRLSGAHRRLEAILVMELDISVEAWRSHDGGLTGPEVDFATDLVLHQLRARHLT